MVLCSPSPSIHSWARSSGSGWRNRLLRSSDIPAPSCVRKPDEVQYEGKSSASTVLRWTAVYPGSMDMFTLSLPIFFPEMAVMTMLRLVNVNALMDHLILIDSSLCHNSSNAFSPDFVNIMYASSIDALHHFPSLLLMMHCLDQGVHRGNPRYQPSS
jgi:hypothetical protein